MREIYRSEDTPEPKYDCLWIADFDSVSDIAAYIDSPLPDRRDKSKSTAITFDPSIRWDLGLGYNVAREMLDTGWQQGADQIHKDYLPVYDRVTSRMIRETLSYDVTGDVLDVERYSSGEPECFGVWTPEVVESAGHRVLTLGYCKTGSYRVSAETLLARGSAVAALIECLEYAGYRVEVYALNAISYPALKRGYSINRCLIKLADESINLARLAFCIAHPAFFRRIGFAIQDHAPKSIYEGYVLGGGNRGYPRHPKALESDYDLFFEGSLLGSIQAGNPESARLWVESELRKQGVQFHE